MAIYSLSQRTASGTAAAAAAEIRTTSGNKPKLMEFGFSIAAATSSQYGLGRPAAIGITPTTPVTFLDEGDGNAPVGQATGAVAWGTGPTVPVAFFRRCSTPATVGAGVIWTFPRGLGIPISSSIVLWNIGTNSVCDLWAILDE